MPSRSSQQRMANPPAFAFGYGAAVLTLRCAASEDWRREGFLNPFCHLVIRDIRWDSHPPCFDGQSIANLLKEARLRLNMPQHRLAAKFGLSLATVGNWENGRTQPNRRFWRSLAALIKDGTQGSAPLEVAD